MRPTLEDLRSAYRLLLGRDPDASGFQHWAARLGELTLDDLVFDFLQSNEFSRRRLARLGNPIAFPMPASPPPRMTPLGSQLVTQAQIDSISYWRWCDEIRDMLRYHRKQWEHVFLLQALDETGMLQPGTRGVGFGVGREPVASVLAKRGLQLLLTDLDPANAERRGWRRGGQHASSIDESHSPEICSIEVFRERVEHRFEDMNAISPDPLQEQFDFLWSLCALEHLGSLDLGMRFIERSLACIRPGGVAIHTTEYNLSSDDETISSGPTVLYRRRDIEALASELTRAGYEIELNLHPGDGPLDRYCDVPPYRSSVHLKIEMERHVVTSLGLLIRKPERRD